MSSSESTRERRLWASAGAGSVTSSVTRSRSMPNPIPPPAASGQTASTEVPLYWCEYGPEQRGRSRLRPDSVPDSVPGERLLVLHGGPGAHHDYLLPQFLRLAERHRLVFYDQRGGGRSRETGPNDVSWQHHVRDLSHVVRELQVAPLTIVGYSWGALLALLYSVESHRHPALPQPQRLVLVDPAPLSRPYRQAFEDEFARRQRSEAIRELREDLADSGLRDSDPDAWRQRQFELGVAPYFADPQAARELTQFRVTAKVQQSVWHSLGDFDVIPDLGTLHLPAF